jgi:hypothetical protein
LLPMVCVSTSSTFSESYAGAVLQLLSISTSIELRQAPCPVLVTRPLKPANTLPIKAEARAVVLAV